MMENSWRPIKGGEQIEVGRYVEFWARDETVDGAIVLWNDSRVRGTIFTHWRYLEDPPRRKPEEWIKIVKGGDRPEERKIVALRFVDISIRLGNWIKDGDYHGMWKVIGLNSSIMTNPTHYADVIPSLDWDIE